MALMFPFNLHWANYLPTSTAAVPAQLTQVNKLDHRQAPFPAIILFPSLCTPQIMTAGPQSIDPNSLGGGGLQQVPAEVLRQLLTTPERVEVLLAAASGVDITPQVVNR